MFKKRSSFFSDCLIEPIALYIHGWYYYCILIKAPPLLYPRCGASLRKEEKGLRERYCIKVKTEFLLALACAIMAVAACCKIWFLARLPVSVAKSASSILPCDADRLTLT